MSLFNRERIVEKKADALAKELGLDGDQKVKFAAKTKQNLAQQEAERVKRRAAEDRSETLAVKREKALSPKLNADKQADHERRKRDLDDLLTPKQRQKMAASETGKSQQRPGKARNEE